MTARTPILSKLKRPESLWTLIVNLVPVFGVVVLGWAALPLLIYYWLENVVIGIVNLPKIVIAGLTKPPPQNWLGLALAPLFAFHYGIFCYVHGAFIFAVFAFADLLAGRGEPAPASFDVLGRVAGMLAADRDLRWSVGVLLAVQLARFAALWLGRTAWRNTDPVRQMLEPYGHIVVLHATILIASIPLLALGQPAIAVVVLALLKVALELGLPQFRIARAVARADGTYG